MAKGFNAAGNVLEELGRAVAEEWSYAQLREDIDSTLPTLRSAYLKYIDNMSDSNWDSLWHLYEYGHGPKKGSIQRLFATRLGQQRFVVYLKQAKRATPLTDGEPREHYQKMFNQSRHVWRTKAWAIEYGGKARTITPKNKKNLLAPKRNKKNPNMPWFITGTVTVPAKQGTHGLKIYSNLFMKQYAASHVRASSKSNNKRKLEKVRARIRRAFMTSK